jgi:hypothetical protein
MGGIERVKAFVVDLDADLQRLSKRSDFPADLLDPVAVPQHETDLVDAVVLLHRPLQPQPLRDRRGKRLFVQHGKLAP